MLRTLVTSVGFLRLPAPQAMAASAVNLDNEPRTLIVTEGGTKTELAIGAGETVDSAPAASSPCPMATAKH